MAHNTVIPRRVELRLPRGVVRPECMGCDGAVAWSITPIAGAGEPLVWLPLCDPCADAFGSDAEFTAELLELARAIADLRMRIAREAA